MSTLIALGRVSTLSLPVKKKKKSKFTVQDETDRTDLTGKVNVEITGLPISTDGVTLTITGSN